MHDIHTTHGSKRIVIEARSESVDFQTEFSYFRGSPRNRSARISYDDNESRRVLSEQGDLHGELKF